jgi:hypothetical protein
MGVKSAKSISYRKNISPLVTIKDAEEVRLRLKNKAAIETPPPPSPLLPAVVEDQNQGKPTILSRYGKIANLRFTLINTLNEEWV